MSPNDEPVRQIEVFSEGRSARQSDMEVAGRLESTFSNFLITVAERDSLMRAQYQDPKPPCRPPGPFAISHFHKLRSFVVK